MPHNASGIQLGFCAADIVEIAALHGRARELENIARGRGPNLPAFGRVADASGKLALCVRPERWLLLSPPASPGVTAALWQSACAGVGVAVDLSSGLAALHLAGPQVCEVLARACRLDLDPQVFPAGSAAATIMVQVSVVLAALPSGLLLLTPSSTARHFREWLAATAKPFGLTPRSDVTVAVLSGDEAS
ncbi:MAG TPA: sarcosine oxidase subunit gamma family protein [Steroidobacteraceae bacterium]